MPQLFAIILLRMTKPKNYLMDGVASYFIGKPNPLRMRTALNYLDVHSED